MYGSGAAVCEIGNTEMGCSDAPKIAYRDPIMFAVWLDEMEEDENRWISNYREQIEKLETPYQPISLKKY